MVRSGLYLESVCNSFKKASPDVHWQQGPCPVPAIDQGLGQALTAGAVIDPCQDAGACCCRSLA